MSITSEKVDDILVLSFSGQINSANASEIEAELLARVNEGEHKLILDLSLLEYISSAGLRVILMLAKQLKQVSGTLLLCHMQPHVNEVFDISGFLAILNVVGTRQEALTRLKGMNA